MMEDILEEDEADDKASIGNDGGKKGASAEIAMAQACGAFSRRMAVKTFYSSNSNIL